MAAPSSEVPLTHTSKQKESASGTTQVRRPTSSRTSVTRASPTDSRTVSTRLSISASSCMPRP